MRRHYTCSFLLGDGRSHCQPALSEVASLTRRWATAPRSGVTDTSTIPDPVDTSDGQHVYAIGDQASLRTIVFTDESHQCFGVRLTHPDSTDPNVLWQTDVCFTSINGDTRLGIITSVGRTSGVISPLPVAPSRPRIVKEIVSRWSAHDECSLQATPHVLSMNSKKDFLDLLLSSKRRLPLLFISAKNADDHPIIDAQSVADKVVGLCHVYVAENRFPSLAMKDDLGQSFNCWDGAVRIYWPRFNTSDDPFRHRVWTPVHIRQVQEGPGGFASKILGLLCRVASTQHVDNQSNWSFIEHCLNQRTFQRARDAGDFESLVKVADADIQALKAENEDLKIRLMETQEESDRLASQVESYRLAYVEARKLASGKAVDEQSFSLVAPTSVEEVVARISEEYSNEIIFALNSKSFVEGNPFEDCENLYFALRFLATTYLDARRGKTSCSDFDAECRTVSEFSYEAHQSEQTMGMFKEYYRCNWKGQSILLKHHIGKGSSKEARYTIRVAFCYDEADERVVVGYQPVVKDHFPTRDCMRGCGVRRRVW